MQSIGSKAPMDLLTNPSSQGSRGKSEIAASSNKGGSSGKAESSSEKNDKLSFGQSLDKAMKEESRPTKWDSAEEDDSMSTGQKVETQASKKKPGSQSNAAPVEEKVVKSANTPNGNKDSDVSDEPKQIFSSGAEIFDRQMVLQNVRKKEAMLKFMDSMENELGVSPEAMVEAMKALGDIEGQKPPVGTMAKVLANLDLEGDQLDRAAELYGNFLSEMSQGRQKPDLESVKTEVHRLQNPAFMAQQDKVSQRRAAIEKITTGFLGGAAVQQGLEQAMQKGPLKEPMDLQREQAMMKVINQFHNVPRQSPVASVNAYSPAAQFSSNGMTDEMTEIISQMQDGSMEELPELQSDFASQLSGNGSGSFRPTSQGTSTDSYGGLGLGSFMAGQSQSMNQQSGSDFGATDSDSSGEESLDGLNEISDESLDFQAGLQDTARPQQGPQSLQKLVSLSAAPGDNNQVENINDIVDQAQLMVRKGGGEMKIQLNPNNLGQIDLKVEVLDGKVNVQMLTDSPEAKKLIENQLADLKHGLSMHKLHVEQLKVDVSSDLAKDFQNQQEEAQKDFAREFARDFMDSRRDGGAFAQREFFSSPFQKYFQQSRPEVEPISTTGVSSRASKNHKGNLNLVA